MKFSYLIFLLILIGIFCSTGCIWFLPEGDVPPNLVGEQNTKTEDLPSRKDSEAAMSGAIVRTLIRNGLSVGKVAMAFTDTSTPQNRSFIDLLHGTGMVWITTSEKAVFFIDSQQKNGVWELRMLRKDGSVAMKKTVKYRQTP